MNVKRLIYICLFLVLLLPFPFFHSSGLYSQDQEKEKQAQQEQPQPPEIVYNEPVTDGPYITVDGQFIRATYIADSKVKSNRSKIFSAVQKVKIPALGQTYSIPVNPPAVPPISYKKVKKIFIVSDVHGQFQWFKELLIHNGVTDQRMRWRFGKDHLVVLGDIMDRGKYVTEVLWAVHQLQIQARRKGGRVHFLLGNHEAMVLQGDLRYVHPKYKYTAKHLMNITVPELYGPGTVLGQWLRTRNTIIKINDILFVHAGIHQDMLTLNLDITTINETIRKNLDTPRKTIKTEPLLNFLFRRNGPLWYRGYFDGMKSYEHQDPEILQHVLDKYKVMCIIVGHTTQKQITPLYQQKVIGVDSGIKYGDRGEALLWKNGKLYRASTSGSPVLLKK